MTTGEAFVIQCPCGAVKMELSGQPFVCLYCHCDDCQAAHGAAYFPAAMYHTEQTRFVSSVPARWRRKTTDRAFCATCGTRLFAEPEGLPMRSISAYLLPPGVFQPTFHMQCRFAVAPIADALPHFKFEAPMFGGPEEMMTW
jgi:hypothetical protein